MNDKYKAAQIILVVYIMKPMWTFILVIIFMFIASSCKKDPLPKASQVGAEIMAAKIDGKVWKKTACFSCIAGGSALRVDFSNGNLYIQGEQNDDDLKTYIALVLRNLTKEGVYDLNIESDNTNHAELSDYTVINFARKYSTNSTNKGSVTITKLDLGKKIVSGTFSFIAEDRNNPGNTTHVTDGRFDVKYD